MDLLASGPMNRHIDRVRGEGSKVGEVALSASPPGSASAITL
jgi:hypothetical protein